ncbi:MAG: hypothetical protein INR70_16195 [Parafilimonas terrae]|nr:hypothetical protein [Parafilimonas terrae]
MPHIPLTTTQAPGTEVRFGSGGASSSTAGGGLLEGAAFVLLCFWTRTSPDRLRSQLTPDTGACAPRGY